MNPLQNEFRIYDVTPPDAQDRSSSKLIAEKTNRAGVATCQAVNAHGVFCSTFLLKLGFDRKTKQKIFRPDL